MVVRLERKGYAPGEIRVRLESAPQVVKIASWSLGECIVYKYESSDTFYLITIVLNYGLSEFFFSHPQEIL